MKRLAVSMFLVFMGCGETMPLVISDPMPPGGAWVDISMTVMGPAANREKQKICMEEARNAGVRLVEGAPVGAALFLSDEGNRLSFADGRPERMLGKWSAKAVCRVAISLAARLDDRVRTSNGQNPPGCRMVGSVEGSDQGYAFFVVEPASYEAALATMQFNALRMGANFVSVDVVRQLGLLTTLNGRAFDCTNAPPATPLPGQQI
jgi:hypothetical protein